MFDAFWVGLIRGEVLIRGGLMKSFDKCHIKSSLSKLLFSILLQEQSKFEHKSLLKSSSSSGVGLIRGGGLIRLYTVLEILGRCT